MWSTTTHSSSSGVRTPRRSLSRRPYRTVLKSIGQISFDCGSGPGETLPTHMRCRMSKKPDGSMGDFSVAVTFPKKHETDIIGLGIAVSGRY